MKHKIEKIIEREDGAVFTVSRGNVPLVDLPQEAIDHLVAQGMDRAQAENLKTTGVSIRIMRAPHMDADVPVDDATKAMIDSIKNMPKK
jgi:hypothetical protein